MAAKLFALLLLLIALFVLVQPVYADPPLNYPGFQQDAEEQYYRGIYDVCRWAMLRAGAGRADATMQCLYFVRQAEKSDWHEQPSTGWPTLERMPVGWGSEA